MKTAEITQLASSAQDKESVARQFKAAPQSAVESHSSVAESSRRPRSNHAYLALVLLLLALLGFFVNNYINDINTEIETIRANVSRPLR